MMNMNIIDGTIMTMLMLMIYDGVNYCASRGHQGDRAQVDEARAAEQCRSNTERHLRLSYRAIAIRHYVQTAAAVQRRE